MTHTLGSGKLWLAGLTALLLNTACSKQDGKDSSKKPAEASVLKLNSSSQESTPPPPPPPFPTPCDPTNQDDGAAADAGTAYFNHSATIPNLSQLLYTATTGMPAQVQSAATALKLNASSQEGGQPPKQTKECEIKDKVAQQLNAINKALQQANVDLARVTAMWQDAGNPNMCAAYRHIGSMIWIATDVVTCGVPFFCSNVGEQLSCKPDEQQLLNLIPGYEPFTRACETGDALAQAGELSRMLHDEMDRLQALVQRLQNQKKAAEDMLRRWQQACLDSMKPN